MKDFPESRRRFQKATGLAAGALEVQTWTMSRNKRGKKARSDTADRPAMLASTLILFLVQSQKKERSLL